MSKQQFLDTYVSPRSSSERCSTPEPTKKCRKCWRAFPKSHFLRYKTDGQVSIRGYRFCQECRKEHEKPTTCTLEDMEQMKKIAKDTVCNGGTWRQVKKALQKAGFDVSQMRCCQMQKKTASYIKRYMAPDGKRTRRPGSLDSEPGKPATARRFYTHEEKDDLKEKIEAIVKAKDYSKFFAINTMEEDDDEFQMGFEDGNRMIRGKHSKIKYIHYKMELLAGHLEPEQLTQFNHPCRKFFVDRDTLKHMRDHVPSLEEVDDKESKRQRAEMYWTWDRIYEGASWKVRDGREWRDKDPEFVDEDGYQPDFLPYFCWLAYAKGYKTELPNEIVTLVAPLCEYSDKIVSIETLLIHLLDIWGVDHKYIPCHVNDDTHRKVKQTLKQLIDNIYYDTNFQDDFNPFL